MTKYYIAISAFESIATGRPLHIPTEIDAEYLKTAEEIISISYTQSEKFSSVSTCTYNFMAIFLTINQKYSFMNSIHPGDIQSATKLCDASQQA